MVRALERQCEVGDGGRVALGHVGMEDLLRALIRRNKFCFHLPLITLEVSKVVSPEENIQVLRAAFLLHFDYCL